MTGARAETIDIAGRRLSFTRGPSVGPTILLLHGFGADRLSFALNEASFAGVGPTIAVDLPGHGDSDVEVGDGGVADFAEIIADFVAALNLGPCHIVGHSLGGAIALTLAAGRPDLVRSLFLLAPAGMGHGVDRAFLEDFSELADAEAAEALLQRTVSRPRLINRHLASRVRKHLEKPGARAGLKRVARRLLGLDLARDGTLEAIARQTLPRAVVWGREDDISPRDEVKLAALGAEIHVLAGVRHLPHVEAPAAVNRLATDFLKRAGAFRTWRG